MRYRIKRSLKLRIKWWLDSDRITRGDFILFVFLWGLFKGIGCLVYWWVSK